jgi:hypothetical protein
VPGEPGSSALLERIHSTDPDVLMPPPNSNRTLSEQQKATLDRLAAKVTLVEDGGASSEDPSDTDARAPEETKFKAVRLTTESTRETSTRSARTRGPARKARKREAFLAKTLPRAPA